MGPSPRKGSGGPTVFTIGHSTRGLKELVELLHQHGVKVLVDIRRFPRSRKNPQFNREALESGLPPEGITYIWMESLGGFRKGLAEASPKLALTNIPFRNYAAYMETEEFRKAIDDLLSLARQTTPAIMCAEALYWRCHRSLVSDYLKSKGVRVVHMMSKDSEREHSYNRFAKVIDGKLTYGE